MIKYVIDGHNINHDVQSMIQVFYPNLKYIQVTEVPTEGISVYSSLNNGLATARLFSNGAMVREYVQKYNDNEEYVYKKRVVKQSIYQLLSQETGIVSKWGILMGIRPAKIVSKLLLDGKNKAECIDYLQSNYFVELSKAELTYNVAKAEYDILQNRNRHDISLYIGIPFCPTRCVYCSFTAYSLKQYAGYVDKYLDTLFKEMDYTTKYLEENDKLKIKNIYIGGGTPTSLDENQLERLLRYIDNVFCTKNIEYTVEAGRPDTITTEKLKLMKDFGVNRISINPQTMNDETLKEIGRNHNSQDIKDVFFKAREVGHDNINMDLILGLTNETPKHIEYTMQEILKLKPDSLTVHTLAVKRASRLKEEIENHRFTSMEDIEKMLEISSEFAERMNMKPYYMYRQKNAVGNFENIGYSLKGKESIYNVEIMEEKQMIIGIGAGSSTKIIDFDGGRKIEHVYNVKGIEEYIDRFDEMILRKKEKLPSGLHSN